MIKKGLHMAERLIKGIMIGLLLLCSLQDMKKKKISLWFILLGGVLISISIPFCDSIPLIDRLGGFAIGLVVIIISLATVGKIGMGDALILCVTGLGLGFWGNLELFAAALFLAAIISIVLLSVRLADRKKSIPFVPFLFAGYLFLLFADKLA